MITVELLASLGLPLSDFNSYNGAIPDPISRLPFLGWFAVLLSVTVQLVYRFGKWAVLTPNKLLPSFVLATLAVLFFWADATYSSIGRSQQTSDYDTEKFRSYSEAFAHEPATRHKALKFN